MIILLSPTKKQNEFSEAHSGSTPFFINEANTLANELGCLSKEELKELFKVSDSIAELNHDRYQQWSSNSNLYRAISIFTGEAFSNLDADSLSRDDLDFLNSNLLIFSGLYGILKPYDIVKNYRLDIGDSLKINGDNLYSFWSRRIGDYLKERAKNDMDSIVLNLASDEYTKKIDFNRLNSKVITPKFLVEKNGKIKTIAIWSKKMRGAFTREVTINRANTIEKLKKIELPGFILEDDFTYIRRES